MALGSTHVQDAHGGDRGRPWRTSTRERPARKALEGRSDGGYDRSDDQDRPAHARRGRVGRSPRAGERGTESVFRDARVDCRPRTARRRTSAPPSAWSRPRHTPHKAGTTATRCNTPGAAAHTLRRATTAGSARTPVIPRGYEKTSARSLRAAPPKETASGGSGRLRLGRVKYIPRRLREDAVRHVSTSERLHSVDHPRLFGDPVGICSAGTWREDPRSLSRNVACSR